MYKSRGNVILEDLKGFCYDQDAMFLSDLLN